MLRLSLTEKKRKNQSLNACEKYAVRCNGLLHDCFMMYQNCIRFWLPWLPIYMRIHEKFNATDGRDRKFGVDFLVHVLLCHFYLNSLDTPNIFKYIQLFHFIYNFIYFCSFPFAKKCNSKIQISKIGYKLVKSNLQVTFVRSNLKS